MSLVLQLVLRFGLLDGYFWTVSYQISHLLEYLVGVSKFRGNAGVDVKNTFDWHQPPAWKDTCTGITHTKE